jgi:hypothetical protein
MLLALLLALFLVFISCPLSLPRRMIMVMRSIVAEMIRFAISISDVSGRYFCYRSKQLVNHGW